MFSWFLTTLREDVLYLKRQADTEEPSWLPDLKEAFGRLGTDKNRKRAVWLLAKAKADVQREILRDPTIRQKRRQQSTKLNKLHARIEQRGNALIATLKEYCSCIHLIPFAEVSSPGSVQELEKGLQEQISWPAEVKNFANEVNRFLSRLKEFRYDFDKAEKAGRQEKARLNTAILALYHMFSQQLSNKRSITLTHTLLYAAGLWTDPNESGLTAKLSSLRQQKKSPSKN